MNQIIKLDNMKNVNSIFRNRKMTNLLLCIAGLVLFCNNSQAQNNPGNSDTIVYKTNRVIVPSSIGVIAPYKSYNSQKVNSANSTTSFKSSSINNQYAYSGNKIYNSNLQNDSLAINKDSKPTTLSSNILMEKKLVFQNDTIKVNNSSVRLAPADINCLQTTPEVHLESTNALNNK
jgi:hypothetical protein